MSLLIAPVVESFIAMLKAMDKTTLDQLAPFLFVGKASTGNLINSPSAYVMGVRTGFPDGGEGSARNEAHLVTIRLGIQGGDPDELANRAMAYVRAVDDAIKAWTFPDYVIRVFVSEHDYGGLYSRGAGVMAFWPDLHCLVEVEEES